jgi:hypothetical protein
MAREFDKLEEKQKVWLLFSALTMAMSEPTEMRKSGETDVYGIARQYRPKLKKSDFDLIKGKTIDEIMKILNE